MSAITRAPGVVVVAASSLLGGFGALFFRLTGKQAFLPTMDDGARAGAACSPTRAARSRRMDRTVQPARGHCAPRRATSRASRCSPAARSSGARSASARTAARSRSSSSRSPSARAASRAGSRTTRRAVARAELAGVKVLARPAGRAGLRISSVGRGRQRARAGAGSRRAGRHRRPALGATARPYRPAQRAALAPRRCARSSRCASTAAARRSSASTWRTSAAR